MEDQNLTFGEITDLWSELVSGKTLNLNLLTKIEENAQASDGYVLVFFDFLRFRLLEIIRVNPDPQWTDLLLVARIVPSLTTCCRLTALRSTLIKLQGCSGSQSSLVTHLG